MAEFDLSPKPSDVKLEISRFLQFGRGAYGSLNADQAAEVDACFERGLRLFLNPPPLPGEKHSHTWTFLRPTTTLTTSANYETGTVSTSGSSTTITLAGGTYPTWAAGAIIVIDSTEYDVITRSGDTAIVIDTALTLSAGTEYSLERHSYTLPDNFGGMVGNFIYRGGRTYPRGEVVNTSTFERTRFASESGRQIGTPSLASIEPIDSTDGTPDLPPRFKVVFYPRSNAVYEMYYTYIANIAIPANIGSDHGGLPGGQQHGETLISACLAIAEEIMDEKTTVKMQQFMSRLAGSVSIDRRIHSPGNLGQNRDESDRLEIGRHPRSDYNVKYTGA